MSFEFQSTPSAWRETQNHLRHEYTSCISIHSLRMEGDDRLSITTICRICISIHSLRMEGDLPVASFLLLFGYFNPLPPHGGRLKGEYSFFAFPEISIHSLRMEGDTFVTLLSIFQKSFQSTPSAWRETSTYKHTAEQSGISIHSLRMEGDLRREKL